MLFWRFATKKKERKKTRKIILNALRNLNKFV